MPLYKNYDAQALKKFIIFLVWIIHSNILVLEWEIKLYRIKIHIQEDCVSSCSFVDKIELWTTCREIRAWLKILNYVFTECNNCLFKNIILLFLTSMKIVCSFGLIFKLERTIWKFSFEIEWLFSVFDKLMYSNLDSFHEY